MIIATVTHWMRLAGSASLQKCEKKIGYEFDGLAPILVDKNLTNESLAILGLGKVPRLAS